MTQVRLLLDQLEAAGVVPTGVADDSRQVRPGDLFLAYPGDLADGRRFIGDAMARGAAAVFWQPGEDFDFGRNFRSTGGEAVAPADVIHFPVQALRALAGPLAHAVYGHPSEALSLIAVTGTNGKTTVSQCLARAYPKSCAIIGTLGAGFPDDLAETGFTTPEATTLMRYLAQFHGAGAAACALEASSIGIEEGRMNGARVDVAVFTNFTRDHLDYHGTMEAYAAAKQKLFVWPRLRAAVINLDDPLGVKLARETTALRVLGYAIGEPRRDVMALVRAEGLIDTPFGQRFDLALPNGRAMVDTPLVGRYNISNLLAVAAVLHDAGVKPAEVARRLSELSPPPGRMERVGGNGEPLVVVDYAHTPDALENALIALREVSQGRGGRLIVVFGCGGDRDKGKRPEMGGIAERLADIALVTSDNPRNESPEAILRDIAAGMQRAELEMDRASAIRRAILAAGDNDVVLLAGKGHEPYQEIAGVRHPFSDVAQAQAALGLRHPENKETAA